MYLTNDYRGVIIALIMMAIVIGISCFCCYCWWKISRNNGGCNSSQNNCNPSYNNDCFQGTTTRTRVVVQISPSVAQRSSSVAQRSPSVTGTVRTVTIPQPSNGVVRLVKLPSSGNSHSNTSNTEPPPPYSNTDAPPSYSEIDV